MQGLYRIGLLSQLIADLISAQPVRGPHSCFVVVRRFRIHADDPTCSTRTWSARVSRWRPSFTESTLVDGHWETL